LFLQERKAHHGTVVSEEDFLQGEEVPSVEGEEEGHPGEEEEDLLEGVPLEEDLILDHVLDLLGEREVTAVPEALQEKEDVVCLDLQPKTGQEADNHTYLIGYFYPKKFLSQKT